MWQGNFCPPISKFVHYKKWTIIILKMPPCMLFARNTNRILSMEVIFPNHMTFKPFKVYNLPIMLVSNNTPVTI